VGGGRDGSRDRHRRVRADAAEAVRAGVARIPQDSWLSRNMANALDLAATTATPLDLVADLNDQVAKPPTASAPSRPKRSPQRSPSSRRQAATRPWRCPWRNDRQQSDSMPAMVGALTGALNGAEALPQRWRDKLYLLRGHCLPHLADTSLTAIADQLVIAAQKNGRADD